MIGACGSQGLCVPTPVGCGSVESPECGCDGVTYSNACKRLFAGVGLKYAGACLVPCDLGSDTCGAQAYCASGNVGTCAGKGFCKAKPDGCGGNVAPVCGCDGKTYNNACEAAVGGVNVSSDGACKPVSCQADVDNSCPAQSWCALAVGVCAGQGLCTPLPGPCPDVDGPPLCGCDGQTWASTCEANAAGIHIKHLGPCKVEPKPCVINAKMVQCEEGQICAAATGQCSGEGVCTDIPEVCPLGLVPICGCDGKTYDTGCDAWKAGVLVAAMLACKPPACKVGDPQGCAKGKFCVVADGACGGEGACTPIPDPCPKYLQPACGCDGLTYGGACYGWKAGVNIAYQGACKVTVCKVGDNEVCGVGRYCSAEEGQCGGEGGCSELPGGCPENIAPVCGCDGKTYGNTCEAGAAGVVVAAQGACKPAVCKVGDPTACGKSAFCAGKTGQCSGEGVCTPFPGGCPDVYKPVCGCDGKTYPTGCDAHGGGVSVAADGVCEVSGQQCGGVLDVVCPKGTVCDYGGCATGASGICTPVPAMCDKVYKPQCGCDGRTWGNSCARLLAGAPLSYEGECAFGTKGCAMGEAGVCGKSSHCAGPLGLCLGKATCAPKPTLCLEVNVPVCGCDGKTYANACKAAAWDVGIAASGGGCVD